MSPYFFIRRVMGSLLLLAATVALVLAWRHYAPILRNLSYFTGWALLAVMLFLTLYNARKKLPFLPLGNSRTWLQLHAYVGFFSAALFLAHIAWRVPSGGFEIMLTLLYLIVAGSGVVGLWWSRYVPKRLTSRGGDVLYERIPIIRRSLQDRAEVLALESVTSGQTTTIADFYSAHLADFFRGPRNFFPHLFEGHGPMNELSARVEDLGRFLTPEQGGRLRELATLAQQKDSLDHQYALQSSLKWWLFIHIPLTYSLLVATGFHVVLVHGFSLGARIPSP